MASQPATPPRSTAVRVGALTWLVQPLYIVCELIAAAAATAPYSLLDNTISDLGATTCTTIAYPYGDIPVCSPLHLLVNGACVVFGLLMAVGAVLLRRWLPRGAAAATAVVLWVVAGLSAVAVGLVPLDKDLDLHVLVALPAFVAQPLALLVTAYAVRRRRNLSLTALVAGALSLVGLVVFVVRTNEGELGGLFERLALWPGYVWPLLLAVVVLRSRRAADATGEGRRSADAPLSR